MRLGSVQFEYPVSWPPQQPRTDRPSRARFGDHSPSKAGERLFHELRLMGAKNVIITTNMAVKLNGGFYANQRVDDPAVVIYFDLRGVGKAMACDLWDKPEHNLWALYLSLQAIRGLERWGGSAFLDALFSGFAALPSPDMILMGEKDYFSGVEPDALHSRYKALAKELHPDAGGSEEEFKIMKRQYEQRKGMVRD